MNGKVILICYSSFSLQKGFLSKRKNNSQFKPSKHTGFLIHVKNWIQQSTWYLSTWTHHTECQQAPKKESQFF